MQADISSYLYIIIAIIWFVAKIMGKGSKNTRKSSTPHAPIPGNFEDISNTPKEGQTQKRPTFEDLLKEFTQEFDQPTKQVSPPQEIILEEELESEPMVHETTYTPVPVIDYDDTPVSITKEGIPTLKELRFETYHIKEEDDHLAEEVNAMLKSPEGIRQAVLINEILNPKYF